MSLDMFQKDPVRTARHKLSTIPPRCNLAEAHTDYRSEV